MKISTVLALGAISGAVIAEESREVVTVTVTGTTDTHRWGRFDKTKELRSSTSSGTHRWGRFDKTKDSSSSTSTGTHRWGRFDKTKDSSSSTSTGTHRWGRFDKTKDSSSSTSTGTHRWGRFDKTKDSSSSTSSGTHRWGRFDKTKEPLTTTVFLGLTENKAVSGNGSNSSSTSAQNGGVQMNTGLSLGVAGAVAAGLLLI